MKRRHGVINRLVLPPYGLSALIDFAEAVEARSAFTKLAYTKFKNAPLYLEWAPDDAFKRPFVKPEDDEDVEEVKEPAEETLFVKEKEKEEKKVDDGEEGHEEGATLFVKNLNFVTTDADLRQHFETCGEVRNLHFSIPLVLWQVTNRCSLQVWRPRKILEPKRFCPWVSASSPSRRRPRRKRL